MSEPNTPPLEPWLIPEAPKTRAPRKKVPKGPAVVITNAKIEVPASPKTPEPPAKPGPEKFTLAEAFDYFYSPDGDETTVNIERATRAVAFLLHWATEMG